MTTSRRTALKLAGAALAGGALAGCAQVARRLPKNQLPETIAPPTEKVAREVRILNRAAYGPLPGQPATVAAIGLEKWVDKQLDANASEDLRLQSQLLHLDIMQVDGRELRDYPEDVMVRQFNQAILLRAAYSENQLFERMVDFWSNHFNIYARKGLASYRKARDEREVIRKNALGKFPDMLVASAKSPAMLAYLDNQFSRKEAPNENYARELMELHTLGVNSGYTQEDIREVARCFTGWSLVPESSIQRGFQYGSGNFRFYEDRHDQREKKVLGHRIAAGRGIEDGEQVLDILAKDPRTASFIAGKMCRYFLGNENSDMRPKVAATYEKTSGDIKAMTRQVLLSEECLEGPAVAKRPIDFLVSSVRATNADSDFGEGLQEHLRTMGQSVYEWPMPDGYPDGAEPWTGSLLARWNFALALTSNEVGGSSTDLADLSDRTESGNLHEIFGGSKIDGFDPAETAALYLSRPEFQWR